MTELRRTLSLAEVIFFGVGSVLGAGIYVLLGKVAGFSGNMLWLAFLISSFTALLSAFSYAELAAAFPRAGGEYVYLKEAIGKKMGIAVGLIISLNGIVSGATVSVGFAGYLAEFMDTPQLLASLGILALIFLVNTAGIRQSSAINILFTSIEIGGLFLVFYCAVPAVGSVEYTSMPKGGLHDLFMASALSFFAYLGFEEIVKLGEETNKPERTIPRALFMAWTIVVVLYILVSLCAVSVLDPQQLAASEAPLADVVATCLGPGGFIAIGIIALFSTANTILSNMLGSSRVLFNMARENKFLARISHVSSKRKTPVAALTLVVVIMAAFALIGKIEVIAFIANIFIFTTFIAVNSAVIILRIRNKSLERPFRIPGNIGNIPIISILGIAMTLLMVVYTVYGLWAGVKM
jgi:basic amino acid/polyamine antiporter, APA family